MFLTAALAASLYLHLGAGVDLDPQHERFTLTNNGRAVQTWQWNVLKPGPLADVAAGYEDGPFYMELHHVSSTTDGFRGSGLTWVGMGMNFKINLGD